MWRFRKSPVRICPRCKTPKWDVPRSPHSPPSPRSRGLGVSAVVGPHRRALLALAAKFGASDLRVFGSVARGDARPNSDIDMLVRFDQPIGLFGRMEFKDRLEQLLGRKVDLATAGNLHWLIRSQVLAEAVPV
ncbi:MAG: nucleotidyltransferase family protein [Candidatus Lutacidiplasmatales archaeon]